MHDGTLKVTRCCILGFLAENTPTFYYALENIQAATVRQHKTILRKANDQVCLNSTLFVRHKLTAYINKTLLNLTTAHFQSSFR